MTQAIGKISIDGREIGLDCPPYIVAEMSANHGGKLDNALKMIEIAKDSGADAVKVQTYRPESLTLESDLPDFRIEDGPWKGRTLFDLYTEAQTPWEWHERLFEKAGDIGITLFSSPFDQEAVDLLESLGCPAYKIASFELVDLPLIQAAAGTGRPIILSTGMAAEDEIKAAVDVAKAAGAGEIALLHCVSAYPTPPSEANLRRIQKLQSVFEGVVGISDHTLGTAVSVAATTLGASIVEKHFTIDRQAGGPDAAFSLEPAELTELCKNCHDAWTATSSRQPSAVEQPSRIFRRSLYVVADVRQGDIFTTKNVRSIRPGLGLHPKYLQKVTGRVALQDISRGTPLGKEMVAWD